MDIEKFSYPLSSFQSLTPDQQSAFLLLGLLVNEINWTQKILLISSSDTTGIQAEEQARLCLSLMMSKILAAKIHEGWCRIESGSIKSVIDTHYLSPKVADLRQQLSPRLAKKSLIYEIRNLHAFHYPTQLSLDGLPGIALDDLTLYATAYIGDTLSVVSELAAAAELMKITQKQTVQDALATTLDETIAVSRLFGELLTEMLSGFTKLMGSNTHQTITNPDAPELLEQRLRFFPA